MVIAVEPQVDHTLGSILTILQYWLPGLLIDRCGQLSLHKLEINSVANIQKKSFINRNVPLNICSNVPAFGRLWKCIIQLSQPPLIHTKRCILQSVLDFLAMFLVDEHLYLPLFWPHTNKSESKKWNRSHNFDLVECNRFSKKIFLS